MITSFFHAQAESVQLSDGAVLNVWCRDHQRAAPTCVLIHGYGDGSHVWLHFSAALASLCPQILVDLRGHGDSSWPGDYTLKTHVADVCHVLQTLQLERVILIGHSLGGHIAFHVAAQQPSRVAGMVIIDFGPEMNPHAMSQARNILKQSLRVYRSAQELQAWLLDSRPLLAPATAEWLAHASVRRGPDGFRLKIDPALAEPARSTPGDDLAMNQALWRILRQLDAPVLLIRGNGSAVLSRDVAERMSKAIANCALEVIEGAGHAVMLDNPERFEAIALPFVSRILRSETDSAASATAEAIVAKDMATVAKD